jgi:hypothetical protein
MQTLKQVLSNNFAHLPRYTPEQVEAARAKVMQANCICSTTCPLCAGIGYIKNEAGKLEVCPNVDPFRMYTGKRYGVEDGEREVTWAKIEPMNNTLEGAAAVRRALTRGYGWVYLWGPPGIGKTLILKIAVAEYLRAHKMAAYTRMAEILDDLRAAFDTRNPSEESQTRLDWWANLPLLAVDEFDRVRATEYSSERRFLLMDRRYEQALREKSITILTSNSDPKLLEPYLYDRIMDGRFEVVHIQGDSFRPSEGI